MRVLLCNPSGMSFLKGVGAFKDHILAVDKLFVTFEYHIISEVITLQSIHYVDTCIRVEGVCMMYMCFQVYVTHF